MLKGVNIMFMKMEFVIGMEGLLNWKGWRENIPLERRNGVLTMTQS
jgi:hypothetical protein